MTPAVVRSHRRGEVAPPRPVAILGMHRSGTSLVAALIAGLGVDLGSAAAMVGAHPLDNPFGYFERRDVQEVNESILTTLHGGPGGWWLPPRPQPGWEAAPKLADQRRAVQAIVTALSGRRWGIKDPRLSLTLPLWRTVAGPMDCVICVRDPAEVAMSLIERDRRVSPDAATADFGTREWGLVWLAYIDAALTHSSGGARMVIDHRHLLRRPRTEVTRLARFLGATPSRAEATALAGLIDTRLWRQRKPAVADTSLHEADERYRRLARAARSRPPAPRG
jgi:hypothetical protein